MVSKTIIVIAAASTLGVAATVNYEAWFVAPKLRAGLLTSLVDADSAQFRGERVVRSGTVICGEFNSKNRLGGYAGFRRYMSTAGGAFAIEGERTATWDDSTQAIMAALQTKSAALRAARQAGGEPPPDFKIEAEVDRRMFSALWDKTCS